jgi:alcohol dehydrogenase
MIFDAAQAFNFLPVPTDIHFGQGMLRSLPELVRGQGGKRAFLVTDPGIRTCGILAQVERLLTEAGIESTTYDRVRPDSGSDLIAEALVELKASAADVVVGIGGGSSLDTSKALAALATNPGSALDYVGLHKVKIRPLPLIAIPTTAGTGSEVTLWSVFTDHTRNQKVAIGGVLMYPAVALCDPELTIDLPAPLTAATGMDALGHAIECYTNNACQPISGALALQAIELIGRHLRSSVLNGRNRQSRYALMLASTLAGIAMNPTRLGLAHALAMPLGSGTLRVPHGVAIAVTLPRVMEFNHLAEPDRYIDVARALGEPVEHLPRLEAAFRAVDAVRRLSADVGIPSGLAAAGVSEQDIEAVVIEAMKSGNVGVNPRRTTLEDLSDILRRSL